MSIERYNDQLMSLLQSSVTIKCKNKVIKTGTIKLFNIKQYFIRFYIEQKNTKETKILELPYPYTIDVDDKNNVNFNYSLSCLKGMSPLIASGGIKSITSKVDKVHKFYNSVVSIIPCI